MRIVITSSISITIITIDLSSSPSLLPLQHSFSVTVVTLLMIVTVIIINVTTTTIINITIITTVPVIIITFSVLIIIVVVITTTICVITAGISFIGTTQSPVIITDAVPFHEFQLGNVSSHLTFLLSLPGPFTTTFSTTGKLLSVVFVSRFSINYQVKLLMAGGETATIYDEIKSRGKENGKDNTRQVHKTQSIHVSEISIPPPQWKSALHIIPPPQWKSALHIIPPPQWKSALHIIPPPQWKSALHIIPPPQWKSALQPRPVLCRWFLCSDGIHTALQVPKGLA
ncbi:hypothetical protein STEG23_001298 [Scotinomys teguina]